jgi:hypothetical protein
MVLNSIDKNVNAIPLKNIDFNRKITLITHSKRLQEIFRKLFTI